jgi:hypothetical protein
VSPDALLADTKGGGNWRTGMTEEQTLVLATSQRLLTSLAALLVEQIAVSARSDFNGAVAYSRTEWGANQGSLGGFASFLL